jgi:uncharacterized protein (DUF2164 family)
MSTIYDMSFTEDDVKNALRRLGEVLKENKESVEIAVAGGVVSLLYFKNRLSTRDIDAVFPDDPWQREALKSAIKKVGKELSLETGLDETWMNDDIAAIGIKEKSKLTIFEHEGIKLVSAKFEELLSHKLGAYRNKNDISDAQALMSELMEEYSDNIEGLFEQVYKLKSFTDRISKDQMRMRFDLVLDSVINPSKENDKNIDYDLAFN